MPLLPDCHAQRYFAPGDTNVFTGPRWGQFTDIKDIKEEMLKRLEVHFEKWLNP